MFLLKIKILISHVTHKALVVTEIIGNGDDAIGKLFTPNNVDDLEKTIVELWNNKSEIVELGEKAFRKLKNEYSAEVIYKKWENLFNSLL